MYQKHSIIEMCFNPSNLSIFFFDEKEEKIGRRSFMEIETYFLDKYIVNKP